MARSYGGRKGKFTVTAQAYQLGGNSHPHFSVTGNLRVDGRDQAGGCMHEDALRFWPKIAPVVRMHLSNADDGEPMHGEANGWYWLSGALGGAGEKYHGAQDDRTADRCLEILAEHLRISMDDATALCDSLKSSHETDVADYGLTESDWQAQRRDFRAFVEAQRPRWKKEAVSALELIKSLA